MSSKINQNISACLGCICEDTKMLVVNSRPLSLGLCDQWSHGVICKHNISKNQGLVLNSSTMVNVVVKLPAYTHLDTIN